MFRGHSVLAIVPARGGSKGVPLKNIHLLGGKPLISWTGEVVQRVPEIDRAIVSSDHPKIIAAASDCGLQSVAQRPSEISGDMVSDIEVLHHELMQAEVYFQQEFQIVLMLQPTAPLRKPEHIIGAMELLLAGDYDSVWSVSPSDPKFHPLKQLRVVDGEVYYYDKEGGSVVARQQLEPLHHRNGAVYAIKRECILGEEGSSDSLKGASLKGARCGAFMVNELMLSIDTLWDFELTEHILRKEGRI